MTPFKAPARVKIVNGLPKSLVGKVLKKELRKMI
jgi:non-ribosomal peptide synthetase component E (peptide arylation enzyme)